MGAKASTYLKRQILNAVLNGGALAISRPLYISLHAGDPGDIGANEITGYSRVLENIWVEDSPTTGKFANNDDLVFGPIIAGDITLTYVGIWDAPSSGNFLWSAALISSVSIHNADSIALAAGAIIAELIEC